MTPAALRDVSAQQPRLPGSDAKPGKGERPFMALARGGLRHLQTRFDQAVYMVLVSYCRVWVGESVIGKCSPSQALMCADLAVNGRNLDQRNLRRSLARIVAANRLQVRQRGNGQTAEYILAPVGFGAGMARVESTRAESPARVDSTPPARVHSTRAESPAEIQPGFIEPPQPGSNEPPKGVLEGANGAAKPAAPLATAAAAAEEIGSSPLAAVGLSPAAAAESDRAAAAAAGNQAPRPPAVETGGGVSEKQIKLLEVCADRLKATATPELWRVAERSAVQAQITAAMEARDEKPRHRHEVDEEIKDHCNRQEETSALYIDGAQRCQCGAVRLFIRQWPEMDPDEYGPWFLCGEIASSVVFDIGDAAPGDWKMDPAGPDDVNSMQLTGWRRPFTWSEVETYVDSGGRPCQREDEDGGEDEDGEDVPTEDVFA